jgi:hypothetical protein
LSIDPNEWHNLATDGSHAEKRAEMKAQMLNLSKRKNAAVKVEKMGGS